MDDNSHEAASMASSSMSIYMVKIKKQRGPQVWIFSFHIPVF